MRQFDSELEAFKKEMKPKLLSELEEFLRRLEANLGSRSLADRVDEFTRQTITQSYNPFIAEQDSRITEAFEGLTSRFEGEVDDLIDSVKQQTSKVFEIKIDDGHASVKSLTQDNRFYFRIEHVFGSDTMLLSELPFFLPKPFFKKTLEKNAKENILLELDKNGGRIRSSFLYRLEESARKLKGDMVSRLAVTIEAIEAAVNSGYHLRKEAIGNLDDQLLQINRFDAELRDVKISLFETKTRLSERAGERADK